MIVNITGTSEINPEQISLVVSILNKIKGPITFKALEPIDEGFMELTSKGMDKKENEWLIFKDLEKISKIYRGIIKVSTDEFLVILTNITLKFSEFSSPKKWFSHFSDNKNIFIRTYNLDELTSNKPELALAHQVIENLFQFYSGYPSGDTKYAHRGKSNGCCINAFCKDEFQLEFKLRSGFICQDCINEFVGNKNNLEIYSQITSTLKSIAAELNDITISEVVSEPKSVEVDDDGIITIGGKELELDDLRRTIYIFFLFHSDNAFLYKDLVGFKSHFLNIYSFFKTNPDDGVISGFLGEKSRNEMKKLEELKIDLNIQPSSENLRRHRDFIKSRLKNIVPQSQLPFYEIRKCKGDNLNEKGDYNKIGLPSGFINISETFLRHRKLI